MPTTWKSVSEADCCGGVESLEKFASRRSSPCVEVSHFAEIYFTENFTCRDSRAVRVLGGSDFGEINGLEFSVDNHTLGIRLKVGNLVGEATFG